MLKVYSKKRGNLNSHAPNFLKPQGYPNSRHAAPTAVTWSAKALKRLIDEGKGTMHSLLPGNADSLATVVLEGESSPIVIAWVVKIIANGTTMLYLVVHDAHADKFYGKKLSVSDVMFFDPATSEDVLFEEAEKMAEAYKVEAEARREQEKRSQMA